MSPEVTVALWTGTLAGVVATAVWAALVWVRRLWRHSRDFGPLAGQYRIDPKLTGENDASAGPKASVSVERNVLSVRFSHLPGVDSVVGEIAMRDDLPRSGQGHYLHTKSGQQLWGVWEAQVKDRDTILVHTSYARTDGVLVTQGFVWRRIG